MVFYTEYRRCHKYGRLFHQVRVEVRSEIYSIREKQVAKTSTPWLNDKCKALVTAKHDAYGTDFYKEAQQVCRKGLYEEYMKHVSKTKERLTKCTKDTKKWWCLSKSILLRKSAASSIPPLQSNDEAWVLESKAKANLLAGVFSTKACLLPPVVNEYSNLYEYQNNQVMSGFLPVRLRWTLQVLNALKVDSGTGPDMLSTKILKHCAKSLALPITMIARKILSVGVWPECWKTHWIYPLHKKKKKSDPNNYRGIHLTSQI